MNKILLCLLLTVISVAASSQRVYFVYLQSEQEQPFFVKMNDRVYSSSPTGYLILSKLKDSTYNLNVGFPQGKWPEQNFTVIVKAKDQGHLLKNFDTKGWGLFDLQTLSVQMAAAKATNESSKAEVKDVSSFTNILAKAADDASLLEKPATAKVEEKVELVDTIVAKKEELKVQIKEPIAAKPIEVVEKPVVKNEPLKTEVKEQAVIKPVEVVENPVVKADPPKTEIKEQVTAKTEEIKEAVEVKANDQKPVEEVEYKKSVVTRRSESSTTEGFGLVFIDELSSGTKDTIRILIPNPKSIAAPVKEELKEEKKFLEITTDTVSPVKMIQPEVKMEEPKPVEVKQPQPVVDTIVAKPLPTNIACKELAVETDFLKLRKAMAATETDEDMLDEARKYFKTKCFATVQIKNLGALFLSDAGKYKFFDQAYSYVSDTENFPSLQSELKEEYYINRFKAMLRN